MRTLILLLLLCAPISTPAREAPLVPTAGACPEMVLRLGHFLGVDDVAYAPDGRSIATAESGVVKLWDARTGELLRILGDGAGVATAIAFAADGRTLVSGSVGGPLRLWDVTSGELLREVRVPAGRASMQGIDVALLPRGAKAVTWSWVRPTLKLWDEASGHRERTLRIPESAVNTAAFSSDGRTVAAGNWNGSVALWDTETGRLVRTLPKDGVTVHAIAFSPDGERLLVSSGELLSWSGGEAQLWDIPTGALLQTMRFGHIAFAVAFSPNGRTLAVGDGTGGGEVRLYEAASGTLQRTLAGNHASVKSLAFSPDGQTLASGGLSTATVTLAVWDVSSGQRRWELTKPARSVEAVGFAPDGRTMTSAGGDGAVQFWDLRTSALQRARRIASADERSAVFTADGRTLVTANSQGGISVWDAVTGERRTTLKGGEEGYGRLVLMPDDRTLLRPTVSGAEVWDLATGALRRKVSVPGERAMAAALAPDGRTVATAQFVREGKPGVIRLWDVATMAPRRTLTTEHRLHDRKIGRATVMDRRILSVAFSPDGAMVAGGCERALRLWDARTGHLLKRWPLAWRVAGILRFSPDGMTVVSGGDTAQPYAGELRLMDRRTGRVQRRVIAGSGAVISLGFTRDGRTLVTGTEDGRLRLWDVRGGALRLTLVPLPPCEEGSPSADWLAFTPDGYYDGSEGAERFIRWRLGNQILRAAAYARTYRRSDMVQAALRGMP